MRLVSALIAGLLFGAGIAISGMINPAKVQNFFDLAGSWDPSLMFVMAGGLITAFIGYRLVFAGRARPLFDSGFHLPVSMVIDAPLIAGAAVFGIGWGVAGFCPGGAIPALGLGDSRTLVFVVAMAAGLGVARFVRSGGMVALRKHGRDVG